jgi:hypothetical protein
MKNLITHIFIIVFVLGFGKIKAQDNLPEYKQLMLDPGNIQFSEIQQKAEAFFEANGNENNASYKQWKRWEYLTKRRLTPDGKVASWSAQNWEAYQQYTSNKNGDDIKVTNGYWDFVGPTYYSAGGGWNAGVGRVNCIAFHPTNANIIYIGTPAGGLWKTTNGGSTWNCLTDGMPSIGVSGIAIHPTNTNIMYILSGDGDGGDTQSIGVLKTTDGGVNWQQTALAWDVTQSRRGYKLAMHPSNSNILFAATTDGLKKTMNGGSSWTTVRTGTIFDFEFKPGDPTIMYCSRSSSFFYRSTDSGDSWTQITAGVPSTATRMAIGVSPDNSSYVYLLTGPSTGVGSFKGVYRSYDSGLNFSLKASTPNILGYDQSGNDNSHQTTYDLAIAVSRTDEADVMTGGINVWTSFNFGSSWVISSWWQSVGNTIGYTHADIHALEINPLNNYIYCGSDGGIFRTIDFGTTWTDLTSGMGNTQWYAIDGTESNSNLLVGGTQDNGSNKWVGTNTMVHIRGADGMDAMIDHSNSNILYTTNNSSSGNGKLMKSTNGGTSFTEITPGGVSGYWVTPLAMNPSNASIIYGGYSDVMKSTNGGSSWTNTGVNGGTCMAIGTSYTGRIYAISITGNTLYRSDNSASSWNTLTGPASNMTYIAVDPGNSLNIFVTIGGYSAANKVFESTDGGVNWTNRTGNLPNVPVNCIAYESGSADGVYIGTDIGIFYRDDNIGDWVSYGNGLPVVPVNDLEINNANGLIRAATYGRGLWSSSLYSACPLGYSLSAANDPSNPDFTGYQFYEASNSITSTRNITGGLGTDVTYKSDGIIILNQGFHAHAGSLFRATLGPCNGVKTSNPGLNGETLAKEDIQGGGE